MMVFSGSVSAQKGVVINVNGSGGLKPKVGEKVLAQVHTPASDNSEYGIKSGKKICMLVIFNGGQRASVLVNLDCSALKGQNTFKVAKVENPKNLNLIKDDKVMLDQATKTLTITRHNKEIMKVSFQ